MKTRLALTLALTGSMLAACGKYTKNPVSDIDTLRANAKTQTGPDQPRVKEVPVDRVITKEVVKEVPRTVYRDVERPVLQATIDQSLLSIIPDAEMNFVEGQPASFLIRARVALKGAKVRLKEKSLPKGAKLEPSKKEAETYVLTWTPELGTVPTGSAVKWETASVVAEIAETANDADRKKLEGLFREKTLNLLVVRDQTPPSDLTIENLPVEIKEGTVTPFDIVVRVPGVDVNSAAKPRLSVTYDGVSLTAGNDFLELDGDRHVVMDANHSEPEFDAKESKWRFHRLFDTKNVNVKPQLARDGSILPKADGTRVRLSFKVYSPYGASTPELVKQIKIRYDKPLAAPRFNLSALESDALEVTPGQSLVLKFVVESADRGNALSVEAADLSRLVGAAKLTCKPSKDGSFRQYCDLQWSVPCDAREQDLNQEIVLKATPKQGEQAGEPVTQTLKTVSAKSPAASCSGTAAPSKPAPTSKPAPAKPVKKESK